jgi:hypothetical protein
MIIGRRLPIYRPCSSVVEGSGWSTKTRRRAKKVRRDAKSSWSSCFAIFAIFATSRSSPSAGGLSDCALPLAIGAFFAN